MVSGDTKGGGEGVGDNECRGRQREVEEMVSASGEVKRANIWCTERLGLWGTNRQGLCENREKVGSVEVRREGNGRPANKAEVKMCAVCRHLTKITRPHQMER